MAALTGRRCAVRTARPGSSPAAGPARSFADTVDRTASLPAAATVSAFPVMAPSRRSAGFGGP